VHATVALAGLILLVALALPPLLRRFAPRR